MSRTHHHDTKRGPLAYGNGNKQRAYGYEFWSRRPFSCIGFGRWLKTMCHRKERRDSDVDLRKTLADEQAPNPEVSGPPSGGSTAPRSSTAAKIKE